MSKSNLTSAQRRALAAEKLALADKALAELPNAIQGEAKSRRVTLAGISASLGDKPSDDRIALVKLNCRASRMALSAQFDNVPFADAFAECLEKANSNLWASPEVAKVGSHQKGKLTDAEYKARRAADMWISTAWADMGRSDALTTKERNDATKKAAKAKEAAEAERLAKLNAKLDEKAGRTPHQNNGGPNADKSDEQSAPRPEASPDKWSVERLNKHAEMQMASLLACLNRTVADTGNKVPNALASAITDAKAIIDKALGIA